MSGKRFLILFKEDDIFDMMGLRKHIDGLNCFDGKAVVDQIGEISAEGCRIAGDIYQSPAA